MNIYCSFDSPISRLIKHFLLLIRQLILWIFLTEIKRCYEQIFKSLNWKRLSLKAKLLVSLFNFLVITKFCLRKSTSEQAYVDFLIKNRNFHKLFFCMLNYFQKEQCLTIADLTLFRILNISYRINMNKFFKLITKTKIYLFQRSNSVRKYNLSSNLSYLLYNMLRHVIKRMSNFLKGSYHIFYFIKLFSFGLKFKLSKGETILEQYIMSKKIIIESLPKFQNLQMLPKKYSFLLFQINKILQRLYLALLRLQLVFLNTQFQCLNKQIIVCSQILSIVFQALCTKQKYMQIFQSNCFIKKINKMSNQVLCIYLLSFLLISKKLMKKQSKLGKQIVNRIYEQFLQMHQYLNGRFMQHQKKQQTKNHKKSRLGIVGKSSNIRSQSNQSKQSKKNQNSRMRKANSLQKLLQIYKHKQNIGGLNQQLKNPFVKIHVRRPSSALSNQTKSSAIRSSEGKLSQQKKLYKNKESERYEQIKKYYQTKYCQKGQEYKIKKQLDKSNQIICSDFVDSNTIRTDRILRSRRGYFKRNL